MEGKLATIWRDEKEVRLGRSSDMETVRREKIHVRRKGREVGKYCVFRIFEDTADTTYVMICDLSIKIKFDAMIDSLILR